MKKYKMIQFRFFDVCISFFRFGFLWDQRSRKPAQSFLALTGTTRLLRWSPVASHMLASASSGGLVCLWDRRHPLVQLSVLSSGQTPVLDLAWSAFDSNHLFTCGGHRSRTKDSGAIKVWDINSSFRDHLSVDIDHGVPTALKPLPFGNAVLVGVGNAATIITTDHLRKAEQVATFQQPKKNNEASGSSQPQATPPSNQKGSSKADEHPKVNDNNIFLVL